MLVNIYVNSIVYLSEWIRFFYYNGMKISKGHNFLTELDPVNSHLHTQLHIRLSSMFKFHELPITGLGGVALTTFSY